MPVLTGFRMDSRLQDRVWNKVQRVVEHEDEREEFLDGYKYSGYEEVGSHYAKKICLIRAFSREFFRPASVRFTLISAYTFIVYTPL